MRSHQVRENESDWPTEYLLRHFLVRPRGDLAAKLQIKQYCMKVSLKGKVWLGNFGTFNPQFAWLHTWHPMDTLDSFTSADLVHTSHPVRHTDNHCQNAKPDFLGFLRGSEVHQRIRLSACERSFLYLKHFSKKKVKMIERLNISVVSHIF